jgi:LysM repeat protein
MFEFTLIKRLSWFVLTTVLALSAVACTRDKPAESPLPTSAAVLVTTPEASAPIPLATPLPTSPLVLPTLPPPVFFTPVVISPTVALPTPVRINTPVPSPIISSPTITPTVAPSTTPGTYTVQWGDWLNKIAAQFGVSVQAIIDANPGIKPDLIAVGQVLNIPAGGTSSPLPTATPGGSTPTTSATSYTVQKGEWLYSIARKLNLSVQAIQGANPGVNLNLLLPGQVINLPGGGTASTSTATGKTHVVKAGETLYSIAVQYGTTPYAIQLKNRLANPNFIYPGQTLTLP